MKNSILILLLISSLFIGCSENIQIEDGDSLLINCPRNNLESNAEVMERAIELAKELTSVINCGVGVSRPICEEDDIYEESAMVIVNEWCIDNTNSLCECDDFPQGFTIADQDELIDAAISLLETQLQACGIEHASYDFDAKPIGPVAPCNGYRIQLRAFAKSYCCAAVG